MQHFDECGTKIVAPLRDAVRLIDHDQRHLCLVASVEHSDEVLLDKTFGCHKEDPTFALGHRGKSLLFLRRRQ
jgi:hypothetical protein